MTHTLPSKRLEPVSAGRAPVLPGRLRISEHERVEGKQPLLLLDNAITQMRHRRRGDDPHAFQLDRLVADVGEQRAQIELPKFHP